ncbi:MAG: hypothetical protein IT199_03620 [Solirubrobacterales bacterium]|nr:hypothetical protein [Solirubrobacterales bacterium]
MKTSLAHPHLLIGTLALVLAAGVLASPASAKVKPKDGAYYQAIGKKSGYIITEKRKITGVSTNLAFRENGAACTPDGLYTYEGVTGVYFAPKRPVGPNARNHFAFRGTKQSSYPKLRTSITGRFISANKATFTIKAWQGKCKASLTLRKAKYTAGG